MIDCYITLRDVFNKDVPNSLEYKTAKTNYLADNDLMDAFF